MTIYEMNFKRLQKLVGKDLKQNPKYLRFESKGFMPLTFDLIVEGEGFARYAMTHWYKQNGDLIADPEMIIEIKGETVEALSIQNAPPFNRIVSVYNSDRTKFSPSQRQSQNSFLGLWLRNIASQGFGRTETIENIEEYSDEPIQSEPNFLECACCGRGFQGWQHYDRDEGYGICDDSFCFKAYGYHTVGERPKNA